MRNRLKSLEKADHAWEKSFALRSEIPNMFSNSDSQDQSLDSRNVLNHVDVTRPGLLEGWGRGLNLDEGVCFVLPSCVMSACGSPS